MWRAYLDVKSGMTIRESASKNDVSDATLARRMRSVVGRPAAFSEYDQFVLAFHTLQASENAEHALLCTRCVPCYVSGAL